MSTMSIMGKAKPPASSSERSILELRKLIEEFLTRVEQALYVPYDLSKAQKDYEKIMHALDKIEKSMAERDMLNVSEKDVVKSAVKTEAVGREMLSVKDSKLAAGVNLEELFQRAGLEKSAVDADFNKIETAASAAQSRGKN